ncbi:MAG: 2Fe-2S iron-sulfur cluster-binding protein, partial [Planctomycetota bacterium]
MLNIEVNNRTVQAGEGEYLLAVLRREGIHVPTLCHIEGLPPSGACRMCLVEVAGAPTLVPSCSYPVAPNMKVKTRSPKVLAARRTIVELLLANHPDDCLYCGRNSKCELQRLANEMGVRQR